MDFNLFKEKAFETALSRGCTAAELYFGNNESFTARIASGEADEYKVSIKQGVNLRVKLDGKDGYAYTEVLDAPEKLVDRAMDNARTIESEDDHPMQGKCEYVAIPEKEMKAFDLSEREKLELGFELERKAISTDERVKRIMYCVIGSVKGETRICNTLGLDAVSHDKIVYDYVLPVAQQGNEVKNGMAFRVGDGIFDIDGCVNEAIAEAVGELGGEPVEAGKYRIIVKNAAMADLLEGFWPMFSADMTQKGLSLLKDKLNEKIAVESLTVMDDPFHEFAPRAFDGEGVPSQVKAVIENGVLKTFLHNLKTAKKEGVASTGNGGRASAASPVGISPSNMYVKTGEHSFESLVNKLDNGIIIKEFSGLHAGLNPVSGEFSLIAKGNLVENGKIGRPVERITVSGSFLELINAIEAIGADIKFGLPSDSTFASPSVLVSGLMVAGK